MQRWKVQSADHQTEQEVILKIVITGLESVLELTNGTSKQNVLLQEHIDIVKDRLAIAAIFSSIYIILSTVYMVVYMDVYIKKCVKKHQQRIQVEELELMESHLASRKEKCRSAAKHRTVEKSSPPPALTQP